MANCIKPCSICSARPEVVEAVNSQLQRRVKLRDIAAASGFSKSSIGRHSLKCIARQTLEAHKSRKFNPQIQLAWYLFPNGDLTAQSIPHGFRGGLRTKPDVRDLIFRVTYEPLPPPKPPKAIPLPVETELEAGKNTVPENRER